MLVPSLMTLGIAVVAVYLSVNTKEEIVKIAMAFIAVLFALFTLVVSPWFVKVLLVAIPLVLDNLDSWSTKNFPN
ncbi:MAG: riboflavin synthase subunit alpha [Moorea sp. SIO2B7]|nr:riboflavin synthase subunit alpha [Moorena sp. SIO2B7]